MGRAVKYGLIMLSISCAIYGLLLMAMYYGPKYEVLIYPRYIIPLAAISPLFYASLIRKGLIKKEKAPLSKRELITFSLITILGVLAASFFAEATLLYNLLSQGQAITFSEVVFSPLNTRYTVTALFGMSFTASAVIVITFVALIRIPVGIVVHLRRAKTGLKDKS